MRQLLPGPIADVDLATAYAWPQLGRLAVRANMVASVDGAATVSGRSGGLSPPADKTLFLLMRSLADIILVGAGTVRAEGYGPARPRPETREARVAAGLAPVPPIAVVTRRLDLDLSTRFFTEATARPIVFTTAAAPADLRAATSEVADVVVAGVERVDAARMLDMLTERGHLRVHCEGGPKLLTDIAAADRLDELCITVSPCLVGGEAMRVMRGAGLPPMGLALVHVLEEAGALYLRYSRVS
jgi:riboflavin biosynthesis pyrimidine reductase